MSFLPTPVHIFTLVCKVHCSRHQLGLKYARESLSACPFLFFIWELGQAPWSFSSRLRPWNNCLRTDLPIQLLLCLSVLSFFLQVLTNALVSWTPELILICILLFCQCLSLVCFHFLNLLYDSLTDMAIYSLCPLVPGFPCSSAGKESACNAGDPGSVPGLGRSLAGGHGNPLQYSCLENSHGQRILEGYSQWGCEESDMTEQFY